MRSKTYYCGTFSAVGGVLLLLVGIPIVHSYMTDLGALDCCERLLSLVSGIVSVWLVSVRGEAGETL